MQADLPQAGIDVAFDLAVPWRLTRNP